MDQAYAFATGIDAVWPPTTDHLSPAAAAELAGLAAANDRAGRLGERSVEILRETGYLGMPVPAELGGGGASLVECCAVQRRLGAADPALSVAANMHLFSLGFMVEHWKRHRDESGLMLKSVAENARIMVSAFAEPGLGGSLTRSNCVARRSGDRWICNGVKVPCSLAGRSDLLCLQMVDEAGGPESLMVAVVERDLPGITVEPTWDTVGMRASESDTVRLTDCAIPDDAVVHRSAPGSIGDEVFAAGNGWFCVTATACYLGLVSAAVDQARAALSAARLSHLDATRAELPSFQSALGGILATMLPLEAACAGLARALDDGAVDPRSLVPSMLGLRLSAADAAIRAVGLTSELVGVATYTAGTDASRLVRDVHAARFHPPTSFVTRQMLGRWALDLPWSFELTERPADPG